MIEIRPQGDKLIWKVAQDVKPNTDIRVFGGACAIEAYNGGVLAVLRPGEEATVNAKRFFERKSSATFDIYGVRYGLPIELRWGTPQSPEYRDDKTGMTLTVKCFGKTTVRIENPSRLFEKFSFTGELSECALNEYIIEKVAACCMSTVTAIAAELKDKAKIEASAPTISERMSDELSRTFEEKYGLVVDDSVVLGLRVEGAEVMTELDNRLALSKKVTELSEEEKKQNLNDVEVLDKTLSALIQKTAAPETKQKTAENSAKSDYKFCSECGIKILRSAKFCPECGTKQ